MKRDIGTGPVAEILGCSPRHVTKLADSGQLPSYKLPGSSHRRFQLDEVLAFAARSGVPVPEEVVERVRSNNTLQSHTAA